MITTGTNSITCSLRHGWGRLTRKDSKPGRNIYTNTSTNTNNHPEQKLNPQTANFLGAYTHHYTRVVFNIITYNIQKIT